jgi:hypothetical protein
MYYKLINNTLHNGLTIYGPGFTLTELEKESYRFPNNQDGWSWFDSIDEARASLELPSVTPPEGYNPAKFLQDMFASVSFEAWLSQFSPFKQSGFMNAATNAKVDNDWSVVQGFYEGMTTAIPPAPEATASWQELADANGIPLVF